MMASAGLELTGIVAVFVLVGWWLDTKLVNHPWFMVTGLTVGTIGGLYNLWRRGRRFFK
jgi:F0F1-type ATP synthase assembly protein I